MKAFLSLELGASGLMFSEPHRKADDNLTEEEYRVYAFDSSLFAGVVAGVYGKPRTYGVHAVYRFGGGY